MIDKTNLKKLGIGSVGDAYLCEDNKVIIIGKREDSFSNYQQLVEKYRLFDGKIHSINYPKIHQLISPCEEFEFGALIESYVGGIELREKVVDMSKIDKIELGKNLALFLNELHKISIRGDKIFEIETDLKKFDKSLNLLVDFLQKEDIYRLKIVRHKYYDFMNEKQFCITHGDLNAGNIMISPENKLEGIIDFGNMEFYVPEVEFAHMFFFDKTICDAMISNYDQNINENDIILLELVMCVRHFKNIIGFETKREKCIQDIKNIMNLYLK